MRTLLLLASLSLIGGFPARAQEAYPGLTLISEVNSTATYLIDMNELIVQTWHGANTPQKMAYLLPDGSILRPCLDPAGYFGAGGAGGRIQWIDADDQVIWDYYYSTSEYQQHHDIEPLPNGNILLIAWEKKTQQEALDAGRVGITGEMWPERIVEIEPVGATGANVVWEWHLWDHIIQDVDPGLPNYGVVADHPERIDINFGVLLTPDWLHVNAISYNPERDEIVFSSRTSDELYVIDHSTTTAEAAGHTGGNSGKGGDILYRWGNPQVYDRGDESDRVFYVIHGAVWIDAGLPGAGNILAFNNGDRPGYLDDYSSVYEIAPPRDANGDYEIPAPPAPLGPAAPLWMYGDPGTFFAGATQGGAYRMPNGNTLITAVRNGRIFEVTESGTIVWETLRGNRVGRAPRYWEEAVAVEPGSGPAPSRSFRLLPGRPNPFGPATSIGFVLAQAGRVTLEVFDLRGRRVAVLADEEYGPGEFRVTWDGETEVGGRAAPGVYLVRLRAGDGSTDSQRVTLLE